MGNGRSKEDGDARSGGVRKQRRGAGGAPLSEWVVAGISLVLVLSMIGYIAMAAVTQRGGPAVLSVEADSIVPITGGYLLMFTLQNRGGETAAAVQVHGELTRGEERIEESQATIDYVPSDAERRGALQFTTDPRKYELDLRVTGFDIP